MKTNKCYMKQLTVYKNNINFMVSFDLKCTEKLIAIARMKENVD